MTPYYEDDSVTIYHGDCREIDAWLDADVLVMDPPYGSQVIGGDDASRGGYGRRQNAARDHATVAGATRREGYTIANDMNTDARDAVLAMWGDRPAMVFGSPRMPDPPMAVKDRLVWDKKRPGMNGGPWRYRHESIYVSDGFERVSDSATSVLAYWPDQAEHIHAKPIELMVWLVGAAPPGVIADPFMGSGTTLRAAKDLGRKAIGIEVEERYCEIAVKRLAQEVLPL